MDVFPKACVDATFNSYGSYENTGKFDIIFLFGYYPKTLCIWRKNEFFKSFGSISDAFVDCSYFFHDK